MLIAVAEYITGKEIVQSLRIVRGNTVRTRHVGHDLAAGLRQIVSGEIKGYTQMITESRNEATKRMIEDAKEMGADAIVGVRYAPADVMTRAAKIRAYGTEVK